MLKNILRAIPLEDYDSDNFDGTLKLVGTGLPYPCSILRIINGSNKDIEISYDGINGHDIVLSGSSIQINTETSATPNFGPALFEQGMKVWVNSIKGAGFVYVVGYYNPPL